MVKVQTAEYVSHVAPPIIGLPGAAAFATGIPWKIEANKLNKIIEIILFIFIYLPFTFTVTLTFWPGFNPVTVAFALFLFVDVLGLVEITAFDGTFAAAAFAAVATFAATDAAATAFVAAAVFVTDSAFTATASVA
jgi:hypothetical protein